MKKLSEPTTTMEDELNIKAEWHDINEVITRMEREIGAVLKQGPDILGEDLYQVKLHMSKGTLDFLKEALM